MYIYFIITFTGRRSRTGGTEDAKEPDGGGLEGHRGAGRRTRRGLTEDAEGPDGGMRKSRTEDWRSQTEDAEGLKEDWIDVDEDTEGPEGGRGGA